MAYQPTKKPKRAAGATAGLAAILIAVVGVEGGYVNDPKDPGGETNHGVTKTVAREEGYTGEMRDLTEEQAIEIYQRRFADKPGFTAIEAASHALGEEVIDMGVNFGTRRPSCYFQRSLNALNRNGRDYPDIAVDCAVGPATMRAYHGLVAKRGERKACELMVKMMDSLQGAEYLRLVERNATLEEYTVGWIDTRIGNVSLERCAP